MRPRFALPVAALAALLAMHAAHLSPAVAHAAEAAAAARPDTIRADSAAADTAHVSPRIVRRFPIEVRAPLHDFESSEGVHLVSRASLRTMPAASLADVIRVQPGVVAEGEDLHVRGGRTGELDETLDGIRLNDVMHGKTMELPLMALRSADLVTGGQDAEHNGSLAGVLVLRTLDPGDHWNAAGRYEGDGELDTQYDRVSARASGPLGVRGLGVAAAIDVSADDSWLPDPRSRTHGNFLGMPWGWRTDNRQLGWIKLAPVGAAPVASLQFLTSRLVHLPWDPAWTKDGWFTPILDPVIDPRPAFSDSEIAGWSRYKAADHLAITDDRRQAAILSLARVRGNRRTTFDAAWTHTRSLTSVGGTDDPSYANAANLPVLGNPKTDPSAPYSTSDPFYIYFGDDPIFRRETSDDFQIRGDQTWLTPHGTLFKAGAGLSYEHANLFEVDGTEFGKQLDSLRRFDAYAPGGFAYAQTRWRHEGLVVNAGLRAQVFSPGPQAKEQSYTGSPRARLSLSPRLGVAYPVSTRDVFSLSYVRLDQDPARYYLYDNRQVIGDRRPLGDPSLEPATVISYQGAVKHLFGPTLAFQAAVFYRDVFGQVGARNFQFMPGVVEPRYTNDDNAHVVGFELSLLQEVSDQQHLEIHYTWMQANGNESRPEGDPNAPLRGPLIPPVSDVPLSWDRRHSLGLVGVFALPDNWFFTWTTTLGSALPWTPAVREEPLTDLSLRNSRRLDVYENSDFAVRWKPRLIPFLSAGFEVRNLFDSRSDLAATVDGYPHSTINTTYDDYAAYRTETGLDGGAYWYDPGAYGTAHWVPVNDPRLFTAPRRFRVSVGFGL